MNRKTITSILAVGVVLYATRARWTPYVLESGEKEQVTVASDVDQSMLLGKVSRHIATILPGQEKITDSGKLFDMWDTVVEVAFGDLTLEPDIATQIDSVWPDIKAALGIGDTQLTINSSARSTAALVFQKVAEAHGQ